jgi:hypothetical protein
MSPHCPKSHCPIYLKFSRPLAGELEVDVHVPSGAFDSVIMMFEEFSIFHFILFILLYFILFYACYVFQLSITVQCDNGCMKSGNM